MKVEEPEPFQTTARGEPNPKPLNEPSPPPTKVGRYDIIRELGRGAFGVVFLGRDADLQRDVAIKVLRSELFVDEGAAEHFAEGRAVARLQHPNIVPIYDVGSSEPIPCFYVSRYIAGTNLAQRLKHTEYHFTEACELVATIADAVQHAHSNGVVHRDVKPANILLDNSGTPYITDFGLALHEDDVEKGYEITGTASYMSPEQARGEGHRIDGRTDIFSLGVVLYRMVTGRMPFTGSTVGEILRAVKRNTPAPIRQSNPGLPRELDRICQKAMEKRINDRYSTAADFAEDLRHLLSSPPEPAGAGLSATVSQTVSTTPMESVTDAPVVASGPTSPSLQVPDSSLSVWAHPKGLRPFDQRDSDFFLHLLPGPRDRSGVPESIRTWQAAIEEDDDDEKVTVGLLYGPSGCGKSSFLRAGLVPRLSERVECVYVEASADRTEAQLLKKLQKSAGAIATGGMTLTEVMTMLRRGRVKPGGERTLIILDQFEQWLHSQDDFSGAELTEALRHCDGARVQCIVVVRDDFWMAATRFMRELEIPLVESRNSAAVDLLTTRRARRTLESFGRSLGALPEQAVTLSDQHHQFLDEAVKDLAEDGHVICMRLTLFVEIMRSREWTSETLQAIGGPEGIGIRFLEETFGGIKAAPRHRLYAGHVRSLLTRLLPPAGVEIRKHPVPASEMKRSSGVESEQVFADIIAILDTELRLITPVDVDGGETCYQLTHDYLVPSLKAWLTQKQQETRHGRAQLQLAELTGLWKARTETRSLPALGEWISISLLTSSASRTEDEQQLMRTATRFHGVRLACLAGLLAIVGFAISRGLAHVQAEKSRGLVSTIANADIVEVARLVAKADSMRPQIDEMLAEELEKRSGDLIATRNLSLALLPSDARLADDVAECLLTGSPTLADTLRHALVPYAADLKGDFWSIVNAKDADSRRRLNGASALALMDPDSDQWATLGTQLASELNDIGNPVEATSWAQMLRPVRDSLREPLWEIYQNAEGEGSPETARAAYLLLALYGDSLEVLRDLQLNAHATQFDIVFERASQLEGFGEQLRKACEAEFGELHVDRDTKRRCARRISNGVIALMRLGETDMLVRLLNDANRNEAVARFMDQADSVPPPPQLASALLKLAGEEPGALRAVMLAFNQSFRRDGVVTEVSQLYSRHPDPGVHAAAAWLLRELGADGELLEAREALETGKPEAGRQWYRTQHNGHELSVVEAGEFMMGSPKDEPERRPTERLHAVKIDRRFAIGMREVSVVQFRAFLDDYPAGFKGDTSWVPPKDDAPRDSVTWFEAAAYCRWLSIKEGFGPGEMCFPEYEQIKPGMRLPDDYLTRTGYRLPTEAEWEFAVRAGSTSSRFLGESIDLLDRYAYFSENSRVRKNPVGALWPNQFGLFDAYGNCSEWCVTSHRSYRSSDLAISDALSSHVVGLSDDRRVLRGGGSLSLSWGVRSARRSNDPPQRRASGSGFRIVRTLPPK